ncbi:hypothetical protein MTO96_020014 [Rhipicephalus appendiculatus]
MRSAHHLPDAYCLMTSVRSGSCLSHMDMSWDPRVADACAPYAIRGRRAFARPRVQLQQVRVPQGRKYGANLELVATEAGLHRNMRYVEKRESE